MGRLGDLAVQARGVQPRDALGAMSVATHGGPDYAEYMAFGIDPNEVIDFSVNANPAPPPPELWDILRRVDIQRYPDTESWRLRTAAAERYGLNPDNVLAGNGSSELIRLICLAYLDPGEAVLLLDPTFGEYEVAARLHGATLARVPWREVVCHPERRAKDPSTVREAGPSLDGALHRTHPKVAFVCNPNNPTGQLIPPVALMELARNHPETLVVLDEAYADFVEGRPTAISAGMPENLVVLRSLTKFGGLAGLRLGLAFGSVPVIANLRKVKPPWNVNALAQEAGIFALTHDEVLPNVPAIVEAREDFRAQLQRLSLQPRESACNFFLTNVEALACRLATCQPGQPGAKVRRALLAKGFLVRDCASFGLPEYIRLSVRTQAENERLVRAIAALGQTE